MPSSQTIRFAIHWFLTVSIILQTPYAFSQSFTERVYNPRSVLDVDYTSFKHENLNEVERRVLEDTFKRPVQISFELLALLDALYKEVERKTVELGLEELNRRVVGRKTKEEIRIELPGVGKAELNAVGNRIFTKVVHYGTGDAHLFFDKNLFDIEFIREKKRTAQEAEHRVLVKAETAVEFLIERQRMFSRAENGSYDAERLNELLELKQVQREREQNMNSKLKLGRRVFSHVYNSNDYKDTKIGEVHKYESRLSLEYWKSYWKGIYETPDRKAINMGIMMGGMQGAIAYAIGGTAPAILSVIFGGVIGVYIRTYINWKTIPASFTVQVIKNWSISMAFAYSLMLWQHGFYGLFLDGIRSLGLNTHIFANNLANNLAKTHFEQIPRMRAIHNESMGEVTVRFLNKVKFDRPSLENQGLYLLLYTFKIADLTDFTIRVPVLGEVKLGKLLLWSSIPIMHYTSLKYAERHHYPEARKLRLEWENSKAFRVPYVRAIHDTAKEQMQRYGVNYQGYSFDYIDYLASESFRKFWFNLTASSHYYYENTGLKRINKSIMTLANQFKTNIEQDLQRMDLNTEEKRHLQNEMRRLYLVQNELQQPHPRQVENLRLRANRADRSEQANKIERPDRFERIEVADRAEELIRVGNAQAGGAACRSIF